VFIDVCFWGILGRDCGLDEFYGNGWMVTFGFA
jgi:hypothetical protein